MFEYNKGEKDPMTREEFDEFIEEGVDIGDFYMSFCEHVTETDPSYKVGDLVLVDQSYESRWYYGISRVGWDERRGKKRLQNISGECGDPSLSPFLEAFFKAHRAKDWTAAAMSAMYAHVEEDWHGYDECDGEDGEDGGEGSHAGGGY